MDTQGGNNWGYPGNANIKRKKKNLREKFKDKSKHNQHPEQPEKQGSPQTGSDSPDGIGFECCWSIATWSVTSFLRKRAERRRRYTRETSREKLSGKV